MPHVIDPSLNHLVFSLSFFFFPRFFLLFFSFIKSNKIIKAMIFNTALFCGAKWNLRLKKQCVFFLDTLHTCCILPNSDRKFVNKEN